MTRRVLFAAFLALCLAGPASAQTQADPVALVRAIYAGYERDKPAAWYDRPYSARLKKLIDADQKSAHKTGDAGHFDWDPIINAQDWKLTDIQISLVSQTAGQAVVDASFHNLDSDQHMRFDLVLQAGKWVIDDLQSLNKPRWTMSKILKDAPDAFPDEKTK
jgi:hypothetical protein